jgi:hypothetical protein
VAHAEPDETQSTAPERRRDFRSSVLGVHKVRMAFQYRTKVPFDPCQSKLGGLRQPTQNPVKQLRRVARFHFRDDQRRSDAQHFFG